MFVYMYQLLVYIYIYLYCIHQRRRGIHCLPGTCSSLSCARTPTVSIGYRYNNRPIEKNAHFIRLYDGVYVHYIDEFNRQPP